MMTTKIHITGDGSPTLFIPELNEHYHSTFGAIQESEHVFIRAGLNYVSGKNSNINILEIGFGTGLNALLTLLHSINHIISYTAIEPFPVSDNLIKKLNYGSLIALTDSEMYFTALHFAPWNKYMKLNDGFAIKKLHTKIQDFDLPKDTYELVYFDAFAPDVQPELWTGKVFEKIYLSMKQGGVLVTYSSKGLVKQNLRAAGFKVVRLPGPPGKRHILRAVK